MRLKLQGARLALLFLFLLLFFSKGHAQTDTEFWFVAPEVSKNGGSNFDLPIYLRISTYTLSATVTVSQPANGSFTPIVVTVPANGFTTIDLSAFLDMVENKPANTILNYGLHITATNPISVYYEVASTYCGCNPELFTLKGRNSVGTNFIIPTQNYFSNSGGYSPTPYNVFDIVATKDNTTVTITPKKDIVGHLAGIPFNITLNQGQSWSGWATSQAAVNHLWGTTVTSTNPISITVTDDLLYGVTGCADLIGDQIVPVDIVGTEYIAVKGNLTNNGNKAFIMATLDNTDVYIDGNAVPVATLAKGMIYDHTIVNASSYIETSLPSYVYQTSGFGCELGGALLPAINCTGSTQVAFTRTTSQSLGLVIATETTNIGNFLVNGDPTMIQASNFTPVPGTAGQWQAANLTLSLAQIPVGTIVYVNNTTGIFHLGLMIGNAGGGCSYGYYSDFARLNLGTDHTICSGDSVTLHAGTGWTSYLWNTGATTESITVKNPGTYFVSVSDPLCNLSDTVVVAHFPVPAVSLGPDHSLCMGSSETLSTTGGPFVQYLWSNGATTPTITINSSGTYSLQVTDNNGCKATDTVVVSVDPGPALTTNPLAKTICSGENSAITLTSSTPGTTFTWTASASSPLVSGFVNGSGTSINQVVTNTSLTNETVTYTIIPESNGCLGSAVDYILTVAPLIPVSVSILSSDNSICSGISVQFTATPINGGSNPSYQWKVNGFDVGTNSSVYSYSPSNSDVVHCLLTSSISCPSNNPALSNPVEMMVNPLMPVSVIIGVSSNPVCNGTPVTFTATPVNGGALPVYQWYVNGIQVGLDQSTYTYVPVNNDHITCVLTSSLVCQSGSPATSNSITENTLPVPVVSFTPCFDTMTTTNAKPIQLKGGIPLGGTYSGVGVSSGYYYPNVAGIGTHQITYSYTNASLCTATRNASIHQYTTSPFTCGNPLTDIRDGKIYQTVQIGSQCWMATNLNYGNQVSSTQHQRDNCIPEKYANPSSLIPGALYQWDELMQYQETPGLQGLCPPGWHLPRASEWTTLFANWSGSGYAGSPLKYSGYSGFNALLAGVNHLNRLSSFSAFATFFWTSEVQGSTKAWAHGMNEYNPSVSLYPSLRSNAFSVRCVRD